MPTENLAYTRLIDELRVLVEQIDGSIIGAEQVGAHRLGQGLQDTRNALLTVAEDVQENGPDTAPTRKLRRPDA